jgi:hypothetical protein
MESKVQGGLSYLLPSEACTVRIWVAIVVVSANRKRLKGMLLRESV